MTDYDNTNRGALWSNKDDKREGKKDPDWRGSINVDGEEYWLSAWRTNSDKPKAPVMSLSVTRKDARRHTNKNGEEIPYDQHPGGLGDALDDEIPF